MVSVIIPVHNAAGTLHKCLDSLISQTYADFEAILVENGSTDDSLAICREYAARDGRFRAYDVGPCGGPSRPRNEGIGHAQGEYVAFLDSDDWFGTDVLSMLHDCFSQSRADIVFFGFCMNVNSETDKRVVFPHVTAADAKEICLQLHEQDCFGYTSCKAFRRSALDGVRFDETVDLFEDELFVLSVLSHTDRIAVVPETCRRPECYYISRASENSLMLRTHPDMIRLKDKEYRAWKAYLGDDGLPSLRRMANRSVSFCRHYIFEHRLPLKASYRNLVTTNFYHDALSDPTPQTKRISQGTFKFRWDWMIWKLKTTLK